MRRTLAACALLLAACSAPELSTEGAKVLWAENDPPSCRAVGTLRESAGGGLRSYEANRARAEVQLRNEAARLGANAMVLTTEVHGESDEGRLTFRTGVDGLTTPNGGCSNCVLLTARAYSCASLPIAQAPKPPPAPPAVPQPPPVVAPPVAAPEPPPAAAPQPIYIPAPTNGPVIIIIQPPPPQMMPAPPPEK